MHHLVPPFAVAVLALRHSRRTDFGESLPCMVADQDHPAGKWQLALWLLAIDRDESHWLDKGEQKLGLGALALAATN